MKTLLLLGALCVAGIACDDPAGEDGGKKPQPAPEITGGLSRTTFTYGCTGPADSQCDDDSDLAPTRDYSPFPQIAVGASFTLAAAAESTTQGYTNLSVGTVDTDFLAYDATTKQYTAKQAGIVSVSASQDNVPVDFANVELVTPARLKLLQAKPDGDFKGVNVDFSGKGVSFSEQQTFTFKFRAVLVDDQDAYLAGAMPCQWTSSNDAIATITGSATDNIVTAQSGTAGTATVSVAYGDFNGTIDITVNQ